MSNRSVVACGRDFPGAESRRTGTRASIDSYGYFALSLDRLLSNCAAEIMAIAYATTVAPHDSIRNSAAPRPRIRQIGTARPVRIACSTTGGEKTSRHDGPRPRSRHVNGMLIFAFLLT